MQVQLNNEEDLLMYEEMCLTDGYEGIMLRTPNGRYKFGRSTEKEQILLKLKRFEDCEATVTGYEERMHNGNEATKDNLGRTERSSHLANLTPMGTLGALIVTNEQFGEFKVGTGLDDSQRLHIWQNREKYLGASITVKYQPTGIKDKPRFPVYKGFRGDI